MSRCRRSKPLGQRAQQGSGALLAVLGGLGYEEAPVVEVDVVATDRGDLAEPHALVEADEHHQGVVDVELVTLAGDLVVDGVDLGSVQRLGRSAVPAVGKYLDFGRHSSRKRRHSNKLRDRAT